MKIRAKWMRSVLTDDVLRLAAKAVRNNRYSAKDQRSGFGLVDVSGQALECVYVRFVSDVDSVRLPNGTMAKEQRFSVDQVEFRLSTEGPGLELRNPSRCSIEMLNALRKIMPEFAYERVEVDPLAWFGRADTELGGGRVAACTSSQFEVSSSVFGRVEVAGSDGVIEQFQRMTNGKKVGIARLSVSWISAQWDVRCVLSRDGSVRLAGDGLGVEKCLDVVRRSFMISDSTHELPS